MADITVTKISNSLFRVTRTNAETGVSDTLNYNPVNGKESLKERFQALRADRLALADAETAIKTDVEAEVA